MTEVFFFVLLKVFNNKIIKYHLVSARLPRANEQIEGTNFTIVNWKVTCDDADHRPDKNLDEKEFNLELCRQHNYR